MLLIVGVICVGLLVLVAGFMFATFVGLGLLIVLVIGAVFVGGALGAHVVGDMGGFILGAAVSLGLVIWAFSAWSQAEEARTAAEKLRLEEEARLKRELEESRKKAEREAASANSILGKLRKWLS